MRGKLPTVQFFRAQCSVDSEKRSSFFPLRRRICDLRKTRVATGFFVASEKLF